MPKEYQYNEYGDADVLKLVDVELPPVGPTEVRVKTAAVGVNFVETAFRDGTYKVPSFPAKIGTAGAGIVDEVGKDVTKVIKGDHVCYATGPKGTYAEYYTADIKFLVKVPKSVSLDAAAATLMRGLTAQYLLRQIRELRKDDVILFHAAAGGLGLIAMQWCRALGVKAIGTASSQEKLDMAKKHGAWETINYHTEDVPKRVKELTGGQGVSTVYDSVGKSTWEISLDSVALKGLVVLFGNASGPVEPLNPDLLMRKGSIFLTRPGLYDYADSPEELQRMADEFFEEVAKGTIAIDGMITRYKFTDAAKAQSDLTGGKTTGSIVLVLDN